jgi:hypothetical protein
MKETVKFETIDITPEMAKAMLEHNKGNRPVKSSVVVTYARDMQKGNWKTDYNPIAFATDGTLKNGQHRLAAIIKSGVTVSMLVARDVDDEAMYDIGANRSTPDVLHFNGKVLEELCKKGYTSFVNYIINTDSKKQSAVEIEKYILENQRYFEKLLYVKENITNRGGSYNNTIYTNLALYSAVRAGEDLDMLKRYYYVYCNELPDNECEFSAVLVKKWVRDNKINANNRIKTNEAIRRIQKSIKYFKEKKSVKRIDDPKIYIYPIE